MMADFQKESVIVYTNLEPVPSYKSLLSYVPKRAEEKEGTFIFK